MDPRDVVLKMGFSLAGGQGWEGEKCLQQNGGRKGLLPTKRKIVAKDCLLTLVKSRLALGSPSCLVVRLVVTVPKMAKCTVKWLLTALE